MALEEVARHRPPMCDSPDTEVLQKMLKLEYLVKEKE